VGNSRVGVFDICACNIAFFHLIAAATSSLVRGGKNAGRVQDRGWHLAVIWIAVVVSVRWSGFTLH